MIRIYHPGIGGDRVRARLTGAAVNHVRRVLRLREGDPLVLFNGDGRDYRARIRSFGKREIVVDIGESRVVDNESPVGLILLQSVCRGPRMDFVIQKSTELGVRRIQ
ncbi:MAG: 16S rRNA (uracil(1498)-N(3))-methyltransferase, partial [Pseudomonadales bacterium]|nr:16S rRNA (uracil(1498)-N(3))-methyltransferase [Pseudomonadales bacterium]